MKNWTDVDLYFDSWGKRRPWTNLEIVLLLFALFMVVMWLDAIDWDKARDAWNAFMNRVDQA